ncbi:MAG: DUF1176 domain-containing protein [Rhizobiaceae bacterium]
MRTALVLACGLTLLAGPAASQDGDYIDDRSDAVSLVRSLYNAINRREYAQAWGYFATPPTDSLEKYRAGYADTQAVELRTGRVGKEGAAGSIYFRLPVAIEAHGTDGGTRVFSGCYEMRMANPEISTDEFTPLRIEGGKFSVSDNPLDLSVPASCDGHEVEPVDDTLDQAVTLYRHTFADQCDRVVDLGLDELIIGDHAISFRYSHDGGDAPMRSARLFQFLCYRGAYNESHVFVYANERDELRPLSFAVPELDIRYRDEDREGPVDAIYVIGFRTQADLANSEFIPESGTLISWAKWRGLADASSVGNWLFRDGEFSLVRFDVDATYDGEINSQTVIDYATGP